MNNGQFDFDIDDLRVILVMCAKCDPTDMMSEVRTVRTKVREQALLIEKAKFEKAKAEKEKEKADAEHSE